MECNREEAVRARDIAEQKFHAKDFSGASKFAQKAQNLFPALEGIGQMIATMNVYIASEAVVHGEKDWYAILSLSVFADDESVRKQYRKLALQLHPDKNKSVGAEGAFHLISEAWNILSDKTKRVLYDQKRNLHVFIPPKKIPTNTFKVPPETAGSGLSDGFYKFAANAASKIKAEKKDAGNSDPHPPPVHAKAGSSFWTACNLCKMQYEYLRIYLNHNLLCPNCKKPFIAQELPNPRIGARQVEPDQDKASSTKKRNFQWGPFSRTAGVASAAASSAAAAQAANVVQQTYEKVRKEREEAQAAAKREESFRRRFNNHLKRTSSQFDTRGAADIANPAKKYKVPSNEPGAAPGIGKTMLNNSVSLKPSGISSTSKSSVAGSEHGALNSFRAGYSKAFTPSDLKTMLVNKGKLVLQTKLPPDNSATAKKSKKQELAETVEQKAASSEITNETKPGNSIQDALKNGSAAGVNSDNQVNDPVTFNVPDPDFHDFDKDRTEKSFGSDQVWATYDDEDGMPRYYVYIQRVLSVKPFKVRLSFLASRSNAEFSDLNWVSSGFSKTCGEFRIGRYEINNVINMFSHKVKWEKGPRGTIRIFPSKGDTWALFKNWSPDWDESTPDNILYSYEMVEVISEYNEEKGILVAPLVKVNGFRTLFRRNPDPQVVWTIPKEEMFRFSHQVPVYKLSGEEGANVPKDCYELDPAATSKDLLQVVVGSGEAP